MKNIAIYCEVDYKNDLLKEVSFELISKAYQLKQKARELTKDEN